MDIIAFQSENVMANRPKKSEIRATVDANFLAELEEQLGVTKSTDVARTALTLLDWAVKEIQNNRMILSATENGKDVHRLVMPEFSHIRREG
jgi:hypothetical protein